MKPKMLFFGRLVKTDDPGSRVEVRGIQSPPKKCETRSLKLTYLMGMISFFLSQLRTNVVP